MRRVSTATCTSGDPVSPSCVRCSWIVSVFCSATANFFFLLFVHVRIIRPIQSLMLPHASLSIGCCSLPENGPGEDQGQGSPWEDSGAGGTKPERLILRRSHQATATSGGMIHHPKTTVEMKAALRPCRTASEALHARATTSAGSQAGGGFGGLATGRMLREIWEVSLLCLRYCILPWTCSIWPLTTVNSRWMESASCTSPALA